MNTIVGIKEKINNATSEAHVLELLQKAQSEYTTATSQTKNKWKNTARRRIKLLSELKAAPVNSEKTEPTAAVTEKPEKTKSNKKSKNKSSKNYY